MTTRMSNFMIYQLVNLSKIEEGHTLEFIVVDENTMSSVDLMSTTLNLPRAKEKRSAPVKTQSGNRKELLLLDDRDPAMDRYKWQMSTLGIQPVK